MSEPTFTTKILSIQGYDVTLMIDGVTYRGVTEIHKLAAGTIIHGTLNTATPEQIAERIGRLEAQKLELILALDEAHKSIEHFRDYLSRQWRGTFHKDAEGRLALDTGQQDIASLYSFLTKKLDLVTKSLATARGGQ